ncbi:unnamed protein product [Trifolium pratense]|uniref:Uncharacterized protein n=1 Tax=Trifolium pratense TaxID=57577 RepID=A0ACB0J115_TRIPR|nr:unnamed protein product [Trifolium pratense]
MPRVKISVEMKLTFCFRASWRKVCALGGNLRSGGKVAPRAEKHGVLYIHVTFGMSSIVPIELTILVRDILNKV